MPDSQPKPANAMQQSPDPHPHQSPQEHAQRHASLGIHGLHQHEAAHDVRRVRRLHQARWMALGVVAVLAVGAIGVVVERNVHAQVLSRQTEAGAQRYVNTVNPKPARAEGKLQLPATLAGLNETPLYAHTSGYVSRWYKDIGDHVKAGDLLAQIETPEVAQQLAQARTTNQQAQSNLEQARSTYERWKALRARDAVPQQELDDRKVALTNAQAAVDTSGAEIKRLEQLLAYNRIVAPFAGTITLRNVEVGNLVDPGNGGLPKAMFSLSQSQVLRTLVQVPQAYAARVRVGQAATVTLRELPGQEFAATVTRTSRAIDAATRTMLVELQVPNPKELLLPGSYGQVSFDLGGAGAAPRTGDGLAVVTLPNNCLLFRPEGSLVAVVGTDHKVHLQPVTLGRDLGTVIELRSGVKLQDAVIVNPPDSIAEGEAVVATPLPPPKDASTSAKGASGGAPAPAAPRPNPSNTAGGAN